MFFKVIGRILAIGQCEYPQVKIVSEKSRQRPFGCFLSRVVAVIVQYNSLSKPFEKPHMLVCHRSTQCRDDSGDSRLMAGDAVHISFHHNCRAAFANRFAGLIEGIQRATFVENRRFRPIPVFCVTFNVAFRQHTSSKGNSATSIVKNRKDDSANKIVVTAAAVPAFCCQSGINQLLR